MIIVVMIKIQVPCAKEMKTCNNMFIRFVCNSSGTIIINHAILVLCLIKTLMFTFLMKH